ncbi:MAG: hypothetical protein JNL74_07155, partial [Fibrobacteres bacterium]|nr:hypothetical protein [Fibrobacterota bacterium]
MVKTEKEVDLLLEKYLNPENGLPAVESLFSELHVLKCDLEKRIQDSIKQQTEITAAMEKLNQRENDFSKLNILLKEKLDKMQNLISGCARDSQQTKESLSKDIVATKNIILQEVKDRIDDVRKYYAD